MVRKPIVRIAAAVTGGLFVAVTLLALLFIVNAGSGLSGTTGATPLGWTVPLIAGALVGAVAWLLLSEDPPELTAEAFSSTCGACGAAVRDDWRLCPYCGAIVDDPRPVYESGAHQVA